MKTTSGSIVVGVDGSEGSKQAVLWAADEARRRHLGLLIVHGLRMSELYYGGGLAGPPLFDAVREAGEQFVSEAKEFALSGGELPVTTEIPVDPPGPLLIDLSKDAPMVVVGASGKGGFTGMLVGSTAAAVSRHAHCPVAVVRGRNRTTYVPTTGLVVVGVDGTPSSEPAIEYAFEEASHRGAELVAVHAWSDVTYDDVYGTARLVPEWQSLEEGEERLFAERLAGWQEKYPDVQVRRHLVRDRARHVLLEQSAVAQLVVVGTRGRGGFRGMLLGSTSQALVQYAECPVLVVPSEAKA